MDKTSEMENFIRDFMQEDYYGNTLYDVPKFTDFLREIAKKINLGESYDAKTYAEDVRTNYYSKYESSVGILFIFFLGIGLVFVGSWIQQSFNIPIFGFAVLTCIVTTIAAYILYSSAGKKDQIITHLYYVKIDDLKEYQSDKEFKDFIGCINSDINYVERFAVGGYKNSLCVMIFTSYTDNLYSLDDYYVFSSGVISGYFRNKYTAIKPAEQPGYWTVDE